MSPEVFVEGPIHPKAPTCLPPSVDVSASERRSVRACGHARRSLLQWLAASTLPRSHALTLLTFLTLLTTTAVAQDITLVEIEGTVEVSRAGSPLWDPA